MTDHTPISKISRLEVITTGARRRWTLEEKQRIVVESGDGNRMVSATARRYGLSASQLFTWRRLAREGRLVADNNGAIFAQAVIVCEPSAFGPAQYPEPAEASEKTPSALSPPQAPGRIEIVLANDRRVIVGHDVEAAVLARVIDVLGAAMIGLPSGMRVYFACGVTDMRKGFDGLAAQVQTVLELDPHNGAVFVFRGKRGNRVT